ncbi:MAG: cellulase family glycosylhydrolase [Kiritimatiellae bacterium]|nr:cellulase family glycosylhydrolase [Kiritimatiellia bacterium]MDW8458186.1 cellulase family glycosylhydrolase [Verrucomicrobiota bacterium]
MGQESTRVPFVAIGGIWFALVVAVVAAPSNPPKLAKVARLDVYAEPEVGAIHYGASTDGGGSIRRASWVSAGERPRIYVATWPIRHFEWTSIGLSFVPSNSGTVVLDLLGQWEMSPSGTIYRQEVLWDAVTAIGASVSNGSFEVMSGGSPVGWFNPWGGPVTLVTNPAPVDGARAVSVWHDRRLRTIISVTAGVPVEIRAWARAAIPEGYIDSQRIEATNTPAHEASRRFMRGVNLANWFEAPPGADWGGGPIGPADLDAIAAEGFDHVRVPVRWSAHTGPAPDYVISNTFFQQVNAVVTGAIARGLGVIVNVHHFDEFFSNPPAWTNKLYAIWDQLSALYAGAPSNLAFEILNEPHGGATTEFMNGVYAYLIPRIRNLHPERLIFVGPGAFNHVEELSNLRLPIQDSNLVVTIHSYEPFLFANQGATWVGYQALTTNLVYPGPPPAPMSPHPTSATDPAVVEWFEQYNSLPSERNPCSSNAFVYLLRHAAAWSRYYGRPVHVGEFGCIAKADASSRARHLREFREEMDRLGLGWALWDWKALYFYWDRSANSPAAGLREALFPPIRLAWGLEPMRIDSLLARGKRIVVEQAEVDITAWSPILTQILDDARFVFPVTGSSPVAAFRLRWISP